MIMQEDDHIIKDSCGNQGKNINDPMKTNDK
jgi:hypothetical protein